MANDRRRARARFKKQRAIRFKRLLRARARALWDVNTPAVRSMVKRLEVVVKGPGITFEQQIDAVSSVVHENRRTGKTTRVVEWLKQSVHHALVVRSLEERQRIIRAFNLDDHYARRIFSQSDRRFDHTYNLVRGFDFQISWDSLDYNAYPFPPSLPPTPEKIKYERFLRGDWPIDAD